MIRTQTQIQVRTRTHTHTYTHTHAHNSTRSSKAPDEGAATDKTRSIFTLIG